MISFGDDLDPARGVINAVGACLLFWAFWLAVLL